MKLTRAKTTSLKAGKVFIDSGFIQLVGRTKLGKIYFYHGHSKIYSSSLSSTPIEVVADVISISVREK